MCVCVVLLYSVQRKARGVLYLIQSFVPSRSYLAINNVRWDAHVGKRKVRTDVLRRGKVGGVPLKAGGDEARVRGLERNES